MAAGLPRPLEAALATGGLVIAGPVLAAAAIAVRLTSHGPAFFRQTRVGRAGRPFTLYKLRSMRAEGTGPEVTASGDTRVTRVGVFLRKTKLDELPQLFNVLRGDLSLVGPRPEVPRYVDLADPLWNAALRVRPGITDPTTLQLRSEEALLATVDDPGHFYVAILLPYKLHQTARYLERRTWATDISVLVQTVLSVVLPSRSPAPSADEIARALGQFEAASHPKIVRPA